MTVEHVLILYKIYKCTLIVNQKITENNIQLTKWHNVGQLYLIYIKKWSILVMQVPVWPQWQLACKLDCDTLHHIIDVSRIHGVIDPRQDVLYCLHSGESKIASDD